jgi:hypothetical protein
MQGYEQHDMGEAPATDARRPKVRRLLSNRKSDWIVAAALMCAVAGISGCAAASTSATTPSPSTTAGHGAPGGFGSGGSNARSGPAAGGTVGTVSSMSTSGFTVSTAGGQKVTIKDTSTTTYQKGTSATAASAVTTGESVLVLGMTDSTTITAAQVTVEPTGDGGTAASSAAGVVPFQRGSSSTAKTVGQIPANYTEGSGTIVSGTTANKAIEAALAAYPGGVVDRVVKLGNGDYEVHTIGVNWPHHVFVNQDFTVVGAD